MRTNESALHFARGLEARDGFLAALERRDRALTEAEVAALGFMSSTMLEHAELIERGVRHPEAMFQLQCRNAVESVKLLAGLLGDAFEGKG